MSKDKFITKWNIEGGDRTIILPTLSIENKGEYSATNVIDWGDGITIEMGLIEEHPVSHKYDDDGEYTVTITGDKFKGWDFNDISDSKNKIIDVSDVSLLQLVNNDNGGYFKGCSNLKWSATNKLDLTGIENLNDMFRECIKFNGDIGNWDVSNVINMENMFHSASLFNKDISNWKVSNVKDMSGMFKNASNFNKDIGEWDVSNVTNMSKMFSNATIFNQDIGIWDVSNVTDMSEMFNGATNFNQDIGLWDVSNVIIMDAMFGLAINFNQDISNWNVSNVTSMGGMFAKATNFNQDIGDWKIHSVTSMILFLTDVKLDTDNYNNILKKWSDDDNNKNNIVIDFGLSNYGLSAVSARNNLINNKDWTIKDNGLIKNDNDILIQKAIKNVISLTKLTSTSINRNAKTNFVIVNNIKNKDNVNDIKHIQVTFV